MIAWLAENLSTIIITIILIVIVGLVIRSMRRDKKNGKSSCGGSCAGCAGCSSCIPKNKRRQYKCKRGDAGIFPVSPLVVYGMKRRSK